MVLDCGKPFPEQIMRMPLRDKAEFMRHALTEAHMYGVPSVQDWLSDQYGLTHAQSLQIAFEILTENGVEPIIRRP